jgi:hypothetical protein
VFYRRNVEDEDGQGGWNGKTNMFVWVRTKKDRK